MCLLAERLGKSHQNAKNFVQGGLASSRNLYALFEVSFFLSGNHMEQGREHSEHAEHDGLPPQLVDGQQPRQAGRRRKCSFTLDEGKTFTMQLIYLNCRTEGILRSHLHWTPIWLDPR